MDNDFLIGGASASLIIMLFIQIIKSYGLPSHLAPLVAIVLGVSFSVLSEWATPSVPTEPISEASRWVAAAVRGFMVAVAAVGIYAVTKNAQDTVDKKRAEDVSEAGEATLATVVSPDPHKEEGGAVVEVVEAAPDKQPTEEHEHEHRRQTQTQSSALGGGAGAGGHNPP